MAANYSYRCPYCDHHIKTTTSPIRFESPLKHCPKCNKIYVDPYSKELALAPYQPQSAASLMTSNVLPGVGSAIIPTILVYVLTKNDMAAWLSLGIGSVIFWLLWFFSSLRNRKKEETNRFTLWQESYERLQNSEYAAVLKKLGYSVPPHYLPPGFAPTAESSPYLRAKISTF